MLRKLVLFTTLLAVLAALFLATFSASPLPAPAPFTGGAPAASPPAEMAIFQLPTGVTHRNAAFAYRGGAFSDARDFAMSALLVKHPQGDLLIDTGLGRDLEQQIGAMPWWFRATTSMQRGRSAGEQLDAAGYDRSGLRAILLTHAHWDHVSGLPEFPGTPVWITAEEHRFIREGGWITALARDVAAAAGIRFEEYGFEDGPYLGFPSSHDVYDDGAIVVVPAPGHTPGSVIVFLTLADRKRYALLGDLVWQREGVTQREERPWLTRTLADVDPRAVREQILRVAAIRERFPELVLVPAHDARGFGELPSLAEAH